MSVCRRSAYVRCEAGMEQPNVESNQTYKCENLGQCLNCEIWLPDAAVLFYDVISNPRFEHNSYF